MLSAPDGVLSEFAKSPSGWISGLLLPVMVVVLAFLITRSIRRYDRLEERTGLLEDKLIETRLLQSEHARQIAESINEIKKNTDATHRLELELVRRV